VTWGRSRSGNATFRGFCAHREALRVRIEATQPVLHAILKRDELDLPVLTTVPE
jgi:hypothetical protein